MPRRRKLWQSLQTVEPACLPGSGAAPEAELVGAPRRDAAPLRVPEGDASLARTAGARSPAAEGTADAPDDLDEHGEVRSPCTGLCAVTAAGRCPGCGRTLLEIASWTSLEAGDRRDVRRRAAARLAGPALHQG